MNTWQVRLSHVIGRVWHVLKARNVREGTKGNHTGLHCKSPYSVLSDGGQWLAHAATVFYVNAGFKLYFLSSPSSRHGVNFSLNPRVSATIDEDYSRWRLIKGIQLEGHVKTVGGIWEGGRITLAFIKKFADVAGFFHIPTDSVRKSSARWKGLTFTS